MGETSDQLKERAQAVQSPVLSRQSRYWRGLNGSNRIGRGKGIF